MRTLVLRSVVSISAIVAIIALFSLSAGPRTADADGTFDPEVRFEFCNTLPSFFDDVDLLEFSGTADTLTATVLTDAAGGFGANNSLVGATITIEGGLGGNELDITANTATTVTVAAGFTGSAGDEYGIGLKDLTCLTGAGVSPVFKANVVPGATQTLGQVLNIPDNEANPGGSLNFSHSTNFLPESTVTTPGCNVDVNDDGTLDTRVFAAAHRSTKRRSRGALRTYTSHLGNSSSQRAQREG